MEDEDVALKIVHTADWHLGKRFGGFASEDQTKLMRARTAAVERVLGLANRHQVDAVLCAGDLFDEPEPDREWWEALAKVFRDHGRPDRPIVLLPGNHDPLRAGSVYSPEHAFRASLPDFVMVVDRDDFGLELSKDAVLFAVPCRSQSGQDDPTRKLPPRPEGDDRIRIGMVHGQTFDHDQCQNNFPIRKEAAHELQLDYLAIGDTHRFKHVATGFDEPVVYPSTPEPTSFKEIDPGFAAYVMFPRRPRRPHVRQEPTAQYLWEQHTLRSIEELRQLARRDDLGRRVVRLVLDLTVSLDEERELRRVLSELRGNAASDGRVAALQVDERRVTIDTGDLDVLVPQLPSVLQRTVAKLRVLETGGDDAQRVRANLALRHLYQELVRRGAAP